MKLAPGVLTLARARPLLSGTLGTVSQYVSNISVKVESVSMAFRCVLQAAHVNSSSNVGSAKTKKYEIRLEKIREQAASIGL